MTNAQPKVQVSCLLKSDGNYLMIRRVKKKAHTFMKLIPAGGHVEIGETLEKAIIREMKEETGVNIHKPFIIGTISFISEIDNSHNVCFIFKALEFSGKTETREPEKVVPEWTNDILMNKDIPSYYKEFFKKHFENPQKFINCTIKFKSEENIIISFD
ncbi:NUDIX domain-containing protein [Staphylococcus pettenkoferi]|uniref:NUDIX domain-containing protein n=1 Tax=Staphylococcus pettenkoferi TaxID=170573 RepID=UPI00066ABEE2|nr:NUDIX hydrolase [Staphylococcus pettenkoferi]MDK7114701.1 NUDIX hydrolase [Staphylococcus pettenkoferi]MDK7283500.1 NUDIX hydrolase [Staphylococcus pettenkoferi]